MSASIDTSEADDREGAIGPDGPVLHPVQVNDVGQINTHLACVGCDYDLYAVLAAGQCPECGIPIALTLRASNDTAWLTNVRSGVQSLLFGHYLVLVSLLVWPMAPISLCFALILQVGSAIDLATRHPGDTTPKARLGILILLIAAGAGLYPVSIIVMLADFALGLALFVVAASLHAGGTALAWSRFHTVMKRGVSEGLANVGRWLSRCTSVLALTLAMLAPVIWLLGATGSSVIASRPLLLILLVPFGIWLLTSLIILHTASRVTRRLVAHAQPADPAETSRQIRSEERR